MEGDCCQTPLVVPVFVSTICDTGCLVVRLAHRPDGTRVAPAFTTLGGMYAAVGRDQAYVLLAESALRELVAPLGVTRLQIDPVLVAGRARAHAHRNEIA